MAEPLLEQRRYAFYDAESRARALTFATNPNALLEFHGLGAPGRPYRAWALAWRLFRQMEARDIKPRLRTYNALMQCLVSANEYELGFELLARVRANSALADRSYPTHLTLLVR